MNLVHQLIRRGTAVIAGFGLAGSMVAFTGTAYAADHHTAPHGNAHGQPAHHGHDDAPSAGTGGSGSPAPAAGLPGPPSSTGSDGSTGSAATAPAVDAPAAPAAAADDSS